MSRARPRSRHDPARPARSVDSRQSPCFPLISAIQFATRRRNRCVNRYYSLFFSIWINIPNGWWYMPPEPAPADPGWDDDPAWSRPDPMTAEELEASLDRLCELDEPPQEEYEDLDPFTAEELA